MNTTTSHPELLAPAGRPDAGYAALHYGADAVYLGLGAFSARAEAVNFTPEELGEFVDYAHSLPRPRRVYLALNTLVQERELPDATAALAVAAGCGVDAVIVQDLGVARLVREYFPSLTLHASTQLAIHSLDGAVAARELGFRRVTLARELTLTEVRTIAERSGIEVETFIHGTLCYSYSGLCLFSSLRTGRSGNRGRCVYSCREAVTTPDGPRHPFSLKDMALGKRVLDLARAGVASLKIEGRKKSPLYVAATVDYYRRILDGRLDDREAADTEARLKTIFARPWTTLFLDSPRNPEAADTEVVGHRGSRIGTVEGMTRTPAGPAIMFRPSLAVERHDGLQVDLPGQARPYGFGVDNLYLMDAGRPESAFAAPAGSRLAAVVPEDAPVLSPGTALYLSSSQAVKRSYPFTRPKPGLYRPRIPVAVRVEVATETDQADTALLTCTVTAAAPAWLAGYPGPNLTVTSSASVPAFPARVTDGAEMAAQAAFARVGGTGFRLDGWQFSNPFGCYIRPGDWNRLRRGALDALEQRLRERSDAVQTAVVASLSKVKPEPATGRTTWSLAVGAPEDLDLLRAEDFADGGEVVVVLDPRREAAAYLSLVRGRFGDACRLALPVIARNDDSQRLRTLAAELATQGCRRWLIPNTASLRWLQHGGATDVAADWPLYVTNTQSARFLLDLGLTGFCLSPEDDAANYRPILAHYPESARLTVFGHPPLFIAASCAHLNLGLCRGSEDHHAGCRLAPGTFDMERSGRVTVTPHACGTVVTSTTPLSLAGELQTLATMGARHFVVDSRWTTRQPAETAALWRAARSGNLPPGSTGNFHRGLV